MAMISFFVQTKFQGENMRYVLVAVIMTIGGLAMAQPTYQNIQCSASGATGYVTGTLSNLPCGNGAGCSTSTFTYQLANQCAGEFNDADVWISGWRWDWESGEHSLHKFKVGVASSSFNSTTQELSFSFQVQALSSSQATDEGDLTLYFQIIATTSSPSAVWSELVRWDQGCDNVNSGSCSSNDTFAGGYSSDVFTGYAIKRFSVVASNGGAGIDPNLLKVDATNWSASGGDIDLTLSCALEDNLAPASFDCVVDLLGIAGASNEVGAYTTPNMVDANKSTAFTTNFSYIFTPPTAMLCGQAAFAIQFDGNANPPVWQWGAGANSTDCAKNLAGYGGVRIGAFGDNLGGSNSNSFTVNQKILGTKLH